MLQEPGPRPRVLVVDDEQRLTDLLRLELDVEGYEVDISNDGASGLIRSRCEPPPTSSFLTGISLTSAALISAKGCGSVAFIHPY